MLEEKEYELKKIKEILNQVLDNKKYEEDHETIKDILLYLTKNDANNASVNQLEEYKNIIFDLENKYDNAFDLSYYYEPFLIKIKKDKHEKEVKQIRETIRNKRKEKKDQIEAMTKIANIIADFESNLNYILTNLEKDIVKANNLEEKLYLEMNKSELINSLSYIYKNIQAWKDSFKLKEYEKVVDNYSEIESFVSQLELCLAEYEEEFHIEGISYSIFEIGKILSSIMERNDKNGR